MKLQKGEILAFAQTKKDGKSLLDYAIELANIKLDVIESNFQQINKRNVKRILELTSDLERKENELNEM